MKISLKEKAKYEQCMYIYIYIFCKHIKRILNVKPFFKMLVKRVLNKVGNGNLKIDEDRHVGHVRKACEKIRTTWGASTPTIISTVHSASRLFSKL